MFVQQLTRTNSIENIYITTPLWWESNGDQWIPCIKYTFIVFISHQQFPFHHLRL